MCEECVVYVCLSVYVFLFEECVYAFVCKECVHFYYFFFLELTRKMYCYCCWSLAARRLARVDLQQGCHSKYCRAMQAITLRQNYVVIKLQLARVFLLQPLSRMMKTLNIS